MIVVFGGSFNPVTKAHIAMAEKTLKEFPLIKKILFLPVDNQYPKDSLISSVHRVNMLNLATIHQSKFEISDIEIKSSGRNYTIDTLDLVQKQYPEEDIYFLLGDDQIKTIHKWKNAENLFQKYGILLAHRNLKDLTPALKKTGLIFSNIIFLDFHSSISSTKIRNYIKHKKKYNHLVPMNVDKYIEEHNLYQ